MCGITNMENGIVVHEKYPSLNLVGKYGSWERNRTHAEFDEIRQLYQDSKKILGNSPKLLYIFSDDQIWENKMVELLGEHLEIKKEVKMLIEPFGSLPEKEPEKKKDAKRGGKAKNIKKYNEMASGEWLCETGTSNRIAENSWHEIEDNFNKFVKNTRKIKTKKGV